ncbi:MAG TPA: hypothetical protein VFT06_00310 [Flavisolibacter sp.]|nr:hypothetical protein [Flavisolibacter sp.]
MKKHKMDRHLVASEQDHELDYIIKKLSAEGYDLGRDDVRTAVLAVGRSRRKVYKYLREHCQGSNITA